MDSSNTIVEAIKELGIENKQENQKLEQDKKKEHDCIELKNLEYKNVLMYGNNLKPRDESVNVSVLEKLLEQERQMNRLDLWSKLDKTDKIIKLKAYTKKMIDVYGLTPEESKRLDNYFLYCLERKYLQKIKDVTYNREKGVIENIPNLIFSEDTRTFALKKGDKHGNTLKSLTPKKNKTQRA